MARLVEKIVLSEADGRALLPILAVLIIVIVGQAGEFIEEVKEIWKEAE